ncbi:hypothetical protein [Paramagnetospirillum caucaseum]|uniref:hypothetical protein n=1 Tax=Paramagnetospirillum caucaseum TaxID=1244869 RepID=UPI001376CB84|nr:hypothetical protein [Paramagnetospirillum caucaseum]
MPKPTQSVADDEAKARAIHEARESVARDGVIAHQDMMAWLGSLGTDHETPPPEPCK